MRKAQCIAGRAPRRICERRQRWWWRWKKRKAKKRRTSTFIDLLFFKHRILQGNGFIMSSRRVNADCPGIIRFVKRSNPNDMRNVREEIVAEVILAADQLLVTSGIRIIDTFNFKIVEN